MSEQRLFYTQFVLLALIASVHIVALKLYLYWYFPLLNRLVHLAGGVWAALIVIWLLTILYRRPSFMLTLSLVLTIGVCWEYFEVFLGMTGEVGYALDTVLDLLMDTLGGIAGYVFANRMLLSPALNERHENERDTIRSHEAIEDNSSEPRHTS